MTDEERARLQAYLTNAALFSDSPPPGHVRREGLLFRLGSYYFPEDQGGTFSLDAAEADAAIAHFSPVMGDLEHRPTVLSGQVGVLRKIWREGDEIMGAADVPQWLHDTLDGSRSKISAAWDRATKTLKGWGWTVDPAIKDAALFTAQATFAATQKDLLAAASAQGAVNTHVATFTSSTTVVTTRQARERKYMPLLDKIKSKLGAGSTDKGTTDTGTTGAAGTANLGDPLAGLTVNQLANLARVLQPNQPGNALAALTGAGKGAEFSATDKTGTTDAGAAETSQVQGTLGTASDMIDEGVAEFRAQQIVTRAEELADRMIADGKAYTYKRDALVALFTSAGYDNEQNGPALVTFTRKEDDRVINDRVQMILEVFDGAPKHSLFSKSMPVNVINGSGDPAGKKSAAEQGAEQAEAFNKQHPAYTASQDKAGKNGHS